MVNTVNNVPVTAHLFEYTTSFGLDPNAEGMATNSARVGNRDTVVATVNAAFAQYPAADLLAKLAEAGIPSGKVRTLDEVYTWDQTRSQGLLIDVDHDVLGPIELPGPAIRFDDHAYAGGREHHQAPPTLDQHGERVRAWLDELDELDARDASA